MPASPGSVRRLGWTRPDRLARPGDGDLRLAALHRSCSSRRSAPGRAARPTCTRSWAAGWRRPGTRWTRRPGRSSPTSRSGSRRPPASMPSRCRRSRRPTSSTSRRPSPARGCSSSSATTTAAGRPSSTDPTDGADCFRELDLGAPTSRPRDRPARGHPRLRDRLPMKRRPVYSEGHGGSTLRDA